MNIRVMLLLKHIKLLPGTGVLIPGTGVHPIGDLLVLSKKALSLTFTVLTRTQCGNFTKTRPEV